VEGMIFFLTLRAFRDEPAFRKRRRDVVSYHEKEGLIQASAIKGPSKASFTIADVFERRLNSSGV